MALVGTNDLRARTRNEATPTLTIAGRPLEPTPVFDTYWRFAFERQQIYDARLAGRPGPWTDDPILQAHRFTNCYRASDRVSQYLISQVIYRGSAEPDEIFFRVLLFKLFNKIETWKLFETELGELSWEAFSIDRYDGVLTSAYEAGERIYSAAYVMPPPQLGGVRKHTNHLRLLDLAMACRLPKRMLEATTMSHAFQLLVDLPAIGPFLGFQLLIDLNYSPVLHFDEMDFVVPGPGARDGIRKCFGPAAVGIETDVIRYMAEHQDEHFARLGLEFSGLRGRPLQLIDCQNLFCEVDKYARVAYPDISGISGRSRIKQRYSPVTTPLTAWFPPKWGINPTAAGTPT